MQPLCIQLVWRELFGLNWFHLYCNPKYTENYAGAHIQGIHRVMFKYSRVWRAELVCLESSKLPAWCPTILSFQTSTCATLFNCMCLVCVCALRVPPVVFQCSLQYSGFLQCHASVGQFHLRFSSGFLVFPCNIRWVAQRYAGVHWVSQLHSSGQWTSQCTLAQGNGWYQLLLGLVRTRVPMSRSRLNNRATMEADILTFTGILTPEAASVAPCLLRLRRKLLRSSTRMRLPILNSVRAWARLFHVSASRGLRPIAAEPQSAQGGTKEQSRSWAKICHFGEVGHWSRSLAAFFFRKFLGD